MVRSRTGWFLVISLAVAGFQYQSAMADDDKSPELFITSPKKADTAKTKVNVGNGKAWKIYSLAELGDDTALCRWIVETIPEVIQAEGWNKDNLKYYAPSKILVVCHTPAVHEQVRAFLQKMKETLPPQKQSSPIAAGTSRKTQVVVPAMFTALAQPAKPAQPATLPESTTNSQQPMHLFHVIVEGLETEGSDKIKLKNFTFRYEGEGIIDSKIAALLKSYIEQAGNQAQDTGKIALNTSQIIQSLQEILKMAGAADNSANPAEPTPAAGIVPMLPAVVPANPPPLSKEPVP